jgi:hypothetical protein
VLGSFSVKPEPKIQLNPRTEGSLRKLQKVMKRTQKWKDFENNGTT